MSVSHYYSDLPEDDNPRSESPVESAWIEYRGVRARVRIYDADSMPEWVTVEVETDPRQGAGSVLPWSIDIEAAR